jgi:hypothetical protein
MKEKIKKICRTIILVGILFPFFSFAQNTNNEFTGTLAIPGTLRDCPSTDCKIIRYYAETAEIKIVGLDDSNEWYQVIANDEYGNKLNGWMHYSLFAQDLRNSFSNNQQKRNNGCVTFNLTGNEKLHCIANDLTWIFVPQNDTTATILFAIKNPYKSWYRVKINKTPQVLSGSYNYSEQQIRTCQWEPRAEREELGYWVEEKYIPENIKSSVINMEAFGKQTLGSKSFYVEKEMAVRECPSSSCYAEWLGGWGGIATVVEQNNNKDWYKVIISNVDTSHFDTVGSEGWVDGGIIPENIKQAFIDSQQKEQAPLTEEDQTSKEETQNKFIPLLSFFQNKNFKTSLIITFISIVGLLSILLLRKKIKAVFQLKWSEINLQKIKSKRKNFTISTLVTIGIVIGIIGISYGAIYYQTSRSIEKAEQLTKVEKYNEAIGELESLSDTRLVKSLGIKKQEISNKIEEVKQLLGDKTEYNQGIDEFNRENWGKAKELLSKVSEISSYYQDAKIKIEEAQNNILKEQIAEAVEKITSEMKKTTGEAQRQAVELEQKVKELEQKQASGQPAISTSLPSSDINKIISSVVSVFCSADRYNLYINYGSGSVAEFSDVSGYFIFTNAHIVSTIDSSSVFCLVAFPKLPSGTPYYVYKTEFYSKSYTGGVDWALLKLTTPYAPKYSLTPIPSLSDYSSCKFSDVNIGDKVTIFGYPVVGGDNITVTEGNISGFSGNDYKVSSGIIDKGNSGGVAILNKYKCSLGIPTWVSIGEASSVGIVQSWGTIYGDLSK